jgi:hypothetical protein
MIFEHETTLGETCLSTTHFHNLIPVSKWFIRGQFCVFCDKWWSERYLRKLKALKEETNE